MDEHAPDETIPDETKPDETKPTEEAAAEWVLLASLLPFEGNPRHNERTIPVVADSIRRFGWGSVIVARRETRQIIAGHARRGAALLLAERWQKATTRERRSWHPEAARTATTGEVPVRWKDLDQHDSTLMLIADNRIGETFSETDDEMLAGLVEDLKAAEVDLLDGTGLTGDAIAELLGEAPAAGGDGATGGDPGDDRYRNQFGVIVICADEKEQARIYEQLRGEGFNCKVVVT